MNPGGNEMSKARKRLVLFVNVNPTVTLDKPPSHAVDHASDGWVISSGANGLPGNSNAASMTNSVLLSRIMIANKLDAGSSVGRVILAPNAYAPGVNVSFS